MDAISRRDLVVVIHSFTTVQMTPAARAALRAMLDAIGGARDLAVISLENELDSSRPAELRLRTYRGNARSASARGPRRGRPRCRDELLARCEYPLGVGHFLDWSGPVS